MACGGKIRISCRQLPFHNLSLARVVTGSRAAVIWTATKFHVVERLWAVHDELPSFFGSGKCSYFSKIKHRATKFRVVIEVLELYTNFGKFRATLLSFQII